MPSCTAKGCGDMVMQLMAGRGGAMICASCDHVFSSCDLMMSFPKFPQQARTASELYTGTLWLFTCTCTVIVLLLYHYIIITSSLHHVVP